MPRLLSIALSLSVLVTIASNAQDGTTHRRVSIDLLQLQTISHGIFEQLDVNANGSITLDEIDLTNEDVEQASSEEEMSLRRRRLRLVNSYFWTEEEINFFEIGDTNNDGSMNRDEFDELETTVRTHVLKLSIKALDTDRNGSVELNEFSGHLEKFDEWDTNQNGTLDGSELADISERRLFTDIRRSKDSRYLTPEERNRIAIEYERRAVERERAKKQKDN